MFGTSITSSLKGYRATARALERQIHINEAAAARSRANVPSRPTPIPKVTRMLAHQPHLHLSLPDLPIKFEQGELTPDGTHFFVRDVYEGESLHPDMISPVFIANIADPIPALRFASTR